MRVVLMLSPLVVLVLSVPAWADVSTRCRCSAPDWVGDCEARLEQTNKWIKIISNTQQCSRVDWAADSNPLVTIVTDGAETQEWLGQNQAPKLQVMSCKVCKDSTRNSPTAAANKKQNPDGAPSTDAAPPNSASFDGHWRGHTTSSSGNQDSEFEIKVVGNSISGYFVNLKGNEKQYISEGTITGNVLSLTTPPTHWTLVLQSDGTIQGKWHQELFFKGSIFLERQ